MSVQQDCLSYLKTLIDNIDWVITGSNRYIYFKYDGGAATKLTLTTGVYSTAEFKTHLKSLIDTAFTETSTVNYSSQKFVIVMSAIHTIQYIDLHSTLEIGFTTDSKDAQGITSDTAVNTYFEYVDYFTEENVGKLGKNYPAVLIEDSDETWEGAGAGSYDIIHEVGLYLYDNINISRISNNLGYQKQITDAINGDTDLGGNAVCANVVSVDKGQYEAGELDPRVVGYNDNISIRRINLEIWEKDNG